MNTKSALRSVYRQKRLNLSASDRLRFDDLLLIGFQQLPIEIPDVILSYAGIEKFAEFEPESILKYCRFKNPDCLEVLPVMPDEGPDLKCVAVSPDTRFEQNRFGIYEPVEGEEVLPGALELILVPLLCFDEAGQRIGYGKGYYDRLLATVNPECSLVGFSYFDPVPAIEDVDPWDIPLHYVVTPHRNYSFS